MIPPKMAPAAVPSDSLGPIWACVGAALVTTSPSASVAQIAVPTLFDRL